MITPLKEAAIATKPRKPAAKKAPAKKPALKKAAAKPVKAKKAAAPKPPAAKKTTPAAKKASGAASPIMDIVMKALGQAKGEDIVSIDLTGKTAIADYMVIVTGTSSRQVTAMAENLRDTLHKQGVRARLEGMENGDWVVLDAGEVIVHFFRPEVRSFYNLEKLWAADFSTTEYTLYKSV